MNKKEIRIVLIKQVPTNNTAKAEIKKLTQKNK